MWRVDFFLREPAEASGEQMNWSENEGNRQFYTTLKPPLQMAVYLNNIFFFVKKICVLQTAFSSSCFIMIPKQTAFPSSGFIKKKKKEKEIFFLTSPTWTVLTEIISHLMWIGKYFLIRHYYRKNFCSSTWVLLCYLQTIESSSNISFTMKLRVFFLYAWLLYFLFNFRTLVRVPS